MFDRCRRHLAASVAILQPTIILAEGWDAASISGRTWSVSRAVATVLDVGVPPVMSSVTVEQRWGRVEMIAAYHPTRNWPSTRHIHWRALEQQSSLSYARPHFRSYVSFGR